MTFDPSRIAIASMLAFTGWVLIGISQSASPSMESISFLAVGALFVMLSPLFVLQGATHAR